MSYVSLYSFSTNIQYCIVIPRSACPFISGWAFTMKLFLKILAMATCQHDIRLEGLFREGHVKLLRQKLLATEAGQAYILQFSAYGWRRLYVYTSKKPNILITVQCMMKTKEAPGLSSWQNFIDTTDVSWADFMRHHFLLMTVRQFSGSSKGTK